MLSCPHFRWGHDTARVLLSICTDCLMLMCMNRVYMVGGAEAQGLPNDTVATYTIFTPEFHNVTLPSGHYANYVLGKGATRGLKPCIALCFIHLITVCTANQCCKRCRNEKQSKADRGGVTFKKEVSRVISSHLRLPALPHVPPLTSILYIIFTIVIHKGVRWRAT